MASYYFFLCIGVVIHQGDGLAWIDRHLSVTGRQASRRSRNFDDVIVGLGPFHERRNELVELCVHCGGYLCLISSCERSLLNRYSKAWPTPNMPTFVKVAAGK